MTDSVRAFSRAQHLSNIAPLAIAAWLLALLFIAAVVTLNVSHVFRANFAGLGLFTAASMAALAGLAGALGPLFVHGALGVGFARRTICLVGGAACLAVCLIVSIGASSSGRSDGTAVRQAAIDARARLSDQREVLTSELDALGSPRDSRIIRADIAGLNLDLRIWRRSAECTSISREDTRKACEPILALRKELGAASRATEIKQALAEIDRTLSMLPSPGAADPQAAQLAWVAARAGLTINPADMGRAANVLWSVCLEIIAALSLSLGTILHEGQGRRVATRDDQPRGGRPRRHSWTAGSERNYAERKATCMTVPARRTTPLTPKSTQPECVRVYSYFRRAAGERPPIPVAMQRAIVETLRPRCAQECEVTAATNRRATRSADRAILTVLRNNGGCLVGSQRALAERCAIPRATLNTALHRLATAGVVHLDVGTCNTTVELVNTDATTFPGLRVP